MFKEVKQYVNEKELREKVRFSTPEREHTNKAVKMFMLYGLKLNLTNLKESVEKDAHNRNLTMNSLFLISILVR